MVLPTGNSFAERRLFLIRFQLNSGLKTYVNVNCDLVGEQRDHPRDWEDKSVPQAEEETGPAGLADTITLRGRAPGKKQRAAAKRRQHQEPPRKRRPAAAPSPTPRGTGTH